MTKKMHRSRSKAKKTKRAVKRLVDHYVHRRTAKHSCMVCKSTMHGMPHALVTNKISKLSKTQKRPTALFAGQLCNSCRTTVLQEAVKVKYSVKELTQVDLLLKPLVEKAILSVE
ncbi:MAG: hypothetical protein Q7K42_00795 [Candidatus Diapherotrites archaeon]|nr:hypothetical protein [Candidatus Diapherotrites archaeon]